MSTIEIYAASVRPGDTVIGVYSTTRNRYDPVVWPVVRATIDTFDGTRSVTIHTGPQNWEQSTLCADTCVKVRTA